MRPLYHVTPGTIVHGPSTEVQATLTSTFALANNRLYAIPFDVKQRVRITNLYPSFSVEDGANVGRMGLYDTLPSGLPGRRIIQSEEFALITLASKEIPEYIAPPGRLWRVFACNSGTAVLNGYDRTVSRLIAQGTAYTDAATALRYAITYASGDDLPDTLDGVAVHAYLTADPPYIGMTLGEL